MQVHTIEMNFDYNVKQILRQIYTDFDNQTEIASFDQYVWGNLGIVGQAFYERCGEYWGDMDETAKDVGLVHNE